MKTTFTVLLLGAALCGCQKPPPPGVIQKWEYKTLTLENSEHAAEEYYRSQLYTNTAALSFMDLNRSATGDFDLDFGSLGGGGWELVSAIPQLETTHLTGHDEIISAVRTAKIILIFKRPMP